MPTASQSTGDFKGANLNAKMFGAKPSISDNGPAFNDAIAALAAVSPRGGGIIKIPAGKYDISTPIIRPRNVLLVGDGGTYDGTTLNWTPTTGVAMIEADGSGDTMPSGGPAQVPSGFRDLVINGPGKSTSTVGIMSGADFDGVLTPDTWYGNRTVWKDLVIQGFGVGIQMGANSYGQNLYNLCVNSNGIGYRTPYSAVGGNFNGPIPLHWHGGIFVNNDISMLTESTGGTLYFHSTGFEYSGPIINGIQASLATAWASGTTYPIGALVSYSGLPYVSLQTSNAGHTPSSSPTWWGVPGVGNQFQFFGCHLEKNGVSDTYASGPFIKDTNAGDGTIVQFTGGFLTYSDAFTHSVSNPYMMQFTGGEAQVKLINVGVQANVDLDSIVYLHVADPARSFVDVEYRGNQFSSTIKSIEDTNTPNVYHRGNGTDNVLAQSTVDAGGPTGSAPTMTALQVRAQTLGKYDLCTYFNGAFESFGLKYGGGIGTSTSSNSIGTGSKTFTTQSSLPYAPGVRLRALSTGSNTFVEGSVISYSGTTLVLNVDVTNGSGTHADWLISFAVQLTLDSLGNLIIGGDKASSVGGMQIGSSASIDRFTRYRNADNPTGMDVGVTAGVAGGAVYVRDNAQLEFATNNVARGRFQANGNFQVDANMQLGFLAGSGSRTVTVDNSGVVGAVTGTPLTNPMTTLGDLIYENGTPAVARLAGNTTTTPKVLAQTGTGSVSAAPSWVDPNTLVSSANGFPGSYISSVALTGQTSSISTTNLQHSGSILPAGRYLVKLYLVCRTSGTGSVTATLIWHDSAASQADTTSSVSMAVQGNHARLDSYIVTDGLNNLTFATTYSSTGTYEIYIDAIRLA